MYTMFRAVALQTITTEMLMILIKVIFISWYIKLIHSGLGDIWHASINIFHSTTHLNSELSHNTASFPY